MSAALYRGRIAPSPTGYLHVGHARTFWIAYERARAACGTLIFRDEDLDPQRSRPGFAAAMLEDLRWLGIEWQEGPDVGGPFAPYRQSERREFYLSAWKRLLDAGFLYACSCSRRDLAESTQAPHENAPHSALEALVETPDVEPIYSGKCRGHVPRAESPGGYNWRFRVPDGEAVRFFDQRQGEQQFTAGRDFGDFVVWRRDDVPAYQLAVIADDAAMQMTEVVRGADLLLSTARQLLLLRALGISPPAYYHCDLLLDEHGRRLAKRHDSLSLRALRAAGYSAQQVREKWAL
jgi:glutamyl/glutaminyl-tRNA synthetase